MKSFFLFFILVFSSQRLWAQSFEKTKLKDWLHLPSGLHKTIDSAYESPTKKSTLTLRKFKVDKDALLKDQVNTWIKDYKSYGFQLKTQKPVKLETGAKGFFIEAYHKDFNQNFSQFISVEKGQMATLTCKSSVKEELSECKEAILAFTWKNDPKH